MPRFFVPSDNIRYEGDKATAAEITGTDVNHIKNVLRAGIGKCILLCDSRGNEYTCIISDISQDRIVADVTEIRKACAEPVVPVLLLQGVPKGDKMDFIVQKGVELGAKAFLPCRRNVPWYGLARMPTARKSVRDGRESRSRPQSSAEEELCLKCYCRLLSGRRLFYPKLRLMISI